MQLSEERIKEYQDIYKRVYGKEISRKEASEQAHNLARFAELALEGYIEQQKLKA